LAYQNTGKKCGEQLKNARKCRNCPFLKAFFLQFSSQELGKSAPKDDGLRAASAVGDNTLEKQQQGTVVPDSFTHGTSEPRQRWFERGLANGDMNNCDTFSATL
jgi:predicted metalloprotease